MKIYIKKEKFVEAFYNSLLKDPGLIEGSVIRFKDFTELNLNEHNQVIICSYSVFTSIDEKFFNKIDKSLVKFIIMGFSISIEDKIKIMSLRWNFIEFGLENNSEENFNKNIISYYYLLRLVVNKNIRLILQNEKINKLIVDSFQIVVSGTKLEESYKKIQDLNQELEYMSKTDDLTKILNRRALFDLVKKQITHNSFIGRKRNKRTNRDSGDSNKRAADNSEHNVFTCAIIDIDFFKKVNDLYGHLTGDKVLIKIGEILSDKNIFRKADITGRLGGEEFLVIFPETTSSHGLIPIKKFASTVKKQKFISDDGKEFNITISAGLAQSKINNSSIREILAKADKALYYAKETGRDRVIVFEEQFTED